MRGSFIGSKQAPFLNPDHLGSALNSAHSIETDRDLNVQQQQIETAILQILRQSVSQEAIIEELRQV